MEEEKDIRLRFMKRAAQLAHYAAENGYGGPFGAVVVKDGKSSERDLTGLPPQTTLRRMLKLRPSGAPAIP